MMGDIQEFFVHNQIGNFYSVSISGYHIAEAGANPISQLAFTLANGFTYVETYLARGMHIDDFAPNLSFFFSNGMDPEYSVIGRVARRIWAVAMKNKYGGSERSQKLKYHIQTSGRSLHAQEMAFNDIRTTLQALIAIYDNCNSLHTNAYDEAITTPTEESVRRAMAIQLVINREWGLAMNENPNQGSFIIDELTDLVEEAVLKEFEAIASRGGVLGAMETGYQRGKIQEESLHYEHKKHDGSFPIVGVNTFRNPKGDAQIEIELARSTEEEKQSQLTRLRDFQSRNADASGAMLERCSRRSSKTATSFAVLIDAVRVCSLGADYRRFTTSVASIVVACSLPGPGRARVPPSSGPGLTGSFACVARRQKKERSRERRGYGLLANSKEGMEHVGYLPADLPEQENDRSRGHGSGREWRFYQRANRCRRTADPADRAVRATASAFTG
jgi:methylmalonyl-CoA mutase